MSRSRDSKEELDRTQSEYSESLKQQRQSFNEFQQCVNKYYWRRSSKCSGMLDSFHKAALRSSIVERERDKLASPLPAELSIVKSMHATCMQQASIIKDANDLVAKKGNTFYLFSGSRDKALKAYSTQLLKCEYLERTQEQLQTRSTELKK